MSVDEAFEFDPQVIARKGRLPAGDTRPAPSVWEGISANFRVTRDDQKGHTEEERAAAAAPILQALRERGINGDRIWGYKNSKGYGDALNYDQMFTDLDAVRRKDPTAFPDVPNTRAEWERKWPEAMRARQAKDADTAGRAGVLPWLAGGAAASMTDLPNVASMFVTGGGTLLWSVSKNVLVNGAVEALEQPSVNAERRLQGRPELTGEERLEGVGLAMVGGAAMDVGGRVVGKVAGAAGGVAGKAVGAVADRYNPIDRQMGRALAGAELDKASNAEILARFDAAVPEHLRTPDQQAARDVFERGAEIDDASPFARTHEAAAAHAKMVDEAMARLVGGASGPARPRASVGQGSNIDAYLAAVKRQESGGNANAQSGTSSASGYYGFTNGTWVDTYRQAFPNSGLSKEAILRRKGDVQLQERLMRKLSEESAAWLGRNGFEADPGNLYVVHHLGQGGANTVLRAADDAPLARILPADVIRANPHMRDMTAGEFRQWAAERMGQRAASGGGGDASVRGMADEDPAVVAARNADLNAESPALHLDDERIDPTVLDGMDAPISAVPELRRDLFPDEESWRAAQAVVDAEALGIGSEAIWHDARAAADTDALPPVPAGYVRMWHGGFAGTEAKQAGDGGRWFSSSRTYAENFGNETGNKKLFFVDIRQDDPLIDAFNIDEFNNVARGVTANVELP